MNFSSVLLIIALCVVGGQCQSSTLTLEDYQSTSTFSLSLSSTGSLSSTWNLGTYPILGNFPCPAAQDAIWSGSQWTCNPNTTSTGDLLSSLTTNCTGTIGGKPANVPKKDSAGNWYCGVDYDIAADLGCSNGQVPKWNATINSFYCGKDNDALTDAAATCTGGGVPRYTATGGLSCGTGADADTLRDLAASGCTNGYTVKYLSGAWTCAPDKSLFLSSACANGTTVKFTQGSWVCAWENDTLRDLISTCQSVGGDVAYVNNNGVWDCLASPVVDLSNPSSTLVLSATIPAPQGVRTPLTGYTGLGGLPWYLPYPGTIKAWSVSGYQKGPATIALAIEGQEIDVLSTTSTSTFFLSNSAVDYNFDSGNIGVSVVQSAPIDIDLEVVIFVEITLN